MALTEPYPLAFLSAILAPISDCQFELIRFEEASGSGSGQQWTAELSDPLWQVTINLSARLKERAREVNAKVTALGTTRSMHFADGSYKPASGATAGTGVTISGVSADRTAISLSGLPAAYRVTAGDRLSITSGGVSAYFGIFAETLTANGSGVVSQIAIEPPLPTSLTTGASVALDRPIIRLRVPPGGFQPFQPISEKNAAGASITFIQKI